MVRKSVDVHSSILLKENWYIIMDIKLIVLILLYFWVSLCLKKLVSYWLVTISKQGMYQLACTSTGLKGNCCQWSDETFVLLSVLSVFMPF